MAKPPKKPDSMLALGQALRRRRQAAEMSQMELAARARLHVNYIGGIERAERNITILSLIKVAEALECSASAILVDASL